MIADEELISEVEWLLADDSWLARFPHQVATPSPRITCREFIEVCTDVRLDEEQAFEALCRIQQLQQQYEQAIGRAVDLRVTMLDFFTNAQRFQSPRVIEFATYKQQANRAARDDLTGLYNRRAILEALRREIARSHRAGTEFSVAMLDIDDFKRFNDDFGHAVGDQVLKAVTEVLTSSLRSADIPSRYGGEEFLLLMPETGTAAARQVTARLLETTRTLKILPQRPIRFSAGIATYPRHGHDIPGVLAAADRCLYQAKKTGKDRVVAPQEQRRTRPRIPLHLPLTLHRQPRASDVEQVVTVDLSQGGARFLGRLPLSPGSEIDLILCEPEGKKQYLLRSRVVWSRRLRRDAQAETGVSFSSDHSDVVQRILDSARN